MKPNRSTNALKINSAIIDFHPDDLASQLTLIDLPIFKSITREELLMNSNSTQRHLRSCPNTQAMKRQFNQLTFWVVRQILDQDSSRQRAELISYFIKTAKRLYQLNNLHSAYAIVSALYSSPIHRLDKTWHYVNKRHPKDRSQFKRLQELFSESNNYEALRKHLDICDLPCIPYLGLYSRDIIYIQEAYHERELMRTKNTCKILESIEKFQASEYNDLVPLPDVQYLLLSGRYLDELQKFIEDENHRRSLELEPPSFEH